MAVLDDIADDLARLTLEAQDSSGDDQFWRQVGKELGTSSQTLEEAFNTAMRVRLSERRARAMIAAKIKEASAQPEQAG